MTVLCHPLCAHVRLSRDEENLHTYVAKEEVALNRYRGREHAAPPRIGERRRVCGINPSLPRVALLQRSPH